MESAASSLGRSFSQKLLAQCSTSLAERGVGSEVVWPDNSAVDKYAPVRAATARFHSRHALQFGVAGMQTCGRVNDLEVGLIGAASQIQGKQPQITRPPPVTRETSVVFEFSLADPPRDQILGRSRMDYCGIPDPEDVAHQLVE